jgi:hypothetical protein
MTHADSLKVSSAPSARSLLVLADRWIYDTFMIAT